MTQLIAEKVHNQQLEVEPKDAPKPAKSEKKLTVR